MIPRKEKPGFAIQGSFHASSSSTRKSQLILHPGSGPVPESAASTTRSNQSTPPDTNHTLTLSHSNPSRFCFRISSSPPTIPPKQPPASHVKPRHGCPSPESKASEPD